MDSGTRQECETVGADANTRELAAVHRMLCAVARSTMDAAAVKQLDDAVAELTSWDAVPALLVRHGLTILGARHLSAVRDRIPFGTWMTIEQQAREAHALALAKANELRRIVDALEARGLAVLAFKGPVLAWRAYGDFGARPFMDLDLLVHPHDIASALLMLGTLGYTPVYRFRDREDAWFRRVDGDYPLLDATGTGLVELHARAMSLRFAGMPPVDVLWQRRDGVPLGNRSIPALCADDALLLQALHGAKHRWERIEWVASVAALLRQRGGDVMPLIRVAPAAQRALLLACAVAASWLDAPLSSETRMHCDGDPVVGRLAAAAWQHLVTGAVDEGPHATAAKIAFNFRVQRGVVARARFIYRWTFWPSPEDWEFVRLPERFFFAYRAVRPLRLLARYGRRITGMMPSHA